MVGEVNRIGEGHEFQGKQALSFIIHDLNKNLDYISIKILGKVNFDDYVIKYDEPNKLFDEDVKDVSIKKEEFKKLYFDNKMNTEIVGSDNRSKKLDNKNLNLTVIVNGKKKEIMIKIVALYYSDKETMVLYVEKVEPIANGGAPVRKSHRTRKSNKSNKSSKKSRKSGRKSQRRTRR